MRRIKARKGMVLVTTLVLTGVMAIVIGALFSYLAAAARQTAIHLGNDVCLLAAQSEIEFAKAALNEGFSQGVARGAHIIGAGDTLGTVNSFDWFGVGDSTTVTRSLGAKNGRGTPVELDECVTNMGCTVKVRFARVNHPANTQWAEVTIVARAERGNPGGTTSVRTVAEVFRFAQERSKVFNNAYFVNNYGWFQGTGCTANGDVRANGDMYLDSGCKINGKVYAAKNEELGVRGDVSNYGKMDSASTYKSTTYGTGNMSRPLQTDPVDGSYVSGGYEAPSGNATTAQLKARVHANEERETEMPFLGDLTSPESDYRLWAEELHAQDPNMCTIRQGGKTIATVYYDGVGPSGDASLADKGVLVLEGTSTKPIEINGPVIVKSDVIIKGYVTGQGTIYSGRNVHIVGNIQYKNPPSWSGKRGNADNGSKDMLGLMAKGNIVMGDYSKSDWHSIDSYLTQQPYVQKYKCDSTDDLIGYPATFGGSYLATEKVTGLDSAYAANAPGGWNRSNGQFGKVREKTVQLNTYHTEYTYDWRGKVTGSKKVYDTATVLSTEFDRKFYESVCLDREISSRCSEITRIDAILYNNHGIFGKLGKCSINGSLVCRNEGLQYSSNLYLNWDIRLYSGSSESVDNDKVGLARGSDNPPSTKTWFVVPEGMLDFN